MLHDPLFIFYLKYTFLPLFQSEHLQIDVDSSKTANYLLLGPVLGHELQVRISLTIT